MVDGHYHGVDLHCLGLFSDMVVATTHPAPLTWARPVLPRSISSHAERTRWAIHYSVVYGGVERSIQAPMVVQKGYHLRCSDKTGLEGPHQKDFLSERDFQEHAMV